MIGKYIWVNLIFLLIGYVIGSINISILLSRRKGDDIRKHGSGNAGTTNALRNYGFKFAILVFLFDLFKSYVPTMILFSLKYHLINTNFFEFVYPIVIGVGVLIGHIFPVFFKFKGGKGVATFFGIILAFNILLFITFVAIYLSLVLITKIVSISSVLSSIVASLLSLINVFYVDFFAFMQTNTIWPIHGIMIVFCAILIMFMHIPNYIKLANKEESKLKFLQ